MRGRCGVPIKNFTYKRKPMNQISHLHGTFTRISVNQDHLPIYNLRGVKVGTGWKALQRLPKDIYNSWKESGKINAGTVKKT